jgi:hypothetical protein
MNGIGSTNELKSMKLSKANSHLYMETPRRAIQPAAFQISPKLRAAVKQP